MLKKIIKGILIIVLVAALGVALIYYTGIVAGRTYQERVNSETSKDLDVYKMQKYAHENAEEILKALEKCDAEKLEESINEPSNVEELINYADWKKLDKKGSTSFGTGSFMPKPDKEGKMDVGEQIILKVGKEKYALYVQTLTSRYGKINDGVTCVAVTTFKHFDEIDYLWLWQSDSKTLRAGKAFY